MSLRYICVIGALSSALFLCVACPLQPIPEGDDLLAQFPAEWPVESFTEEQLADAIACANSVREQAESRYPESVSLDDLPSAVPLETACDWAALAVAYSARNRSDAGAEAYLTAVYLNPAYSLITDLLYDYFASQPLVEAPPITDQPLTSATITYSYSGLGSGSNYTITITTGSDVAQVTGSGNGGTDGDYEVNETLDMSIVEPLGHAPTDLIPIDNEMELIVCYDNYPDWVVELTYADGTRITARTNGSNVLNGGGPWQTVIDGQTYVQMGTGLLDAVATIHDALRLPWGETAAMYCSGAPNMLEAGFEGE